MQVRARLGPKPGAVCVADGGSTAAGRTTKRSPHQVLEASQQSTRIFTSDFEAAHRMCMAGQRGDDVAGALNDAHDLVIVPDQSRSRARVRMYLRTTRRRSP